MFEHVKTYPARPTLYVAWVIAIGALLAPALGGSGAQGVTTYTRAVSCHGFHWQPLGGSTASWSGLRRTSGSSGWFVCNPNLPHKAVVTRVRFTLHDETPYGLVQNCGLVRSALDPATATIAQVMASAPSTSDPPPAIQRLQDATINYATIDNMKYAYYLQCYIFAAGAYYEGIYGADITFKITAGNG